MIKDYESAAELEEALDHEISKTKSSLGDYLRRLDEIRSLAEKSKKIREVVLKLAGKKHDVENLGEVDVGGMKVVLDAGALDELISMESVVRSYQERLLSLQKSREALKPLDDLGETEGVKLTVVESDGIPERILLKTC